jgi:hypothetical protein
VRASVACDGQVSDNPKQLPTDATGRFGEVEIMKLCDQTTFRSNLVAAPIWVSGRAEHPAWLAGGSVGWQIGFHTMCSCVSYTNE